MEKTLGSISAEIFVALALIVSGCDNRHRQDKLENKWNSAESKGSKPYTLPPINGKRGVFQLEYIDTNFDGNYDLVRGSDRLIYSEIPETSQEDLRK